jgi:formylglycine-generating enzyme required for sulfatase activity
MKKSVAVMLQVLIFLAGATGAGADVFHMPSGQTSLEFVTVDDPGNLPDTRLRGDHSSGYGGVAYLYQIGKYEVTAGQYTAFLNVVAKSDPYELYNTGMDTASPPPLGCNIKRSGSSGTYTYSVALDWAERPVSDVSWGDAARFANWLTNGQPTGAQDLSTTEDGSYFLDGAMTYDALMAVTRKANAVYVIPTEDEWYKAAYYKGGGTNAGYWSYATQSDNRPISEPPGGHAEPPGSANISAGFGSSPTYVLGYPFWRTEVGMYRYSPSPYETFDQTGNVKEWNQTVVTIHQFLGF